MNPTPRCDMPEWVYCDWLRDQGYEIDDEELEYVLGFGGRHDYWGLVDGNGYISMISDTANIFNPKEYATGSGYYEFDDGWDHYYCKQTNPEKVSGDGKSEWVWGYRLFY